ncbi:MAG: hypothetical protein J6I64_09065 [Lachnospiraceae bacterium]|nr:hypothetical protein [Lachnospiraceae bacterium]
MRGEASKRSEEEKTSLFILRGMRPGGRNDSVVTADCEKYTKEMCTFCEKSQIDKKYHIPYDIDENKKRDSVLLGKQASTIINTPGVYCMMVGAFSFCKKMSPCAREKGENI